VTSLAGAGGVQFPASTPAVASQSTCIYHQPTEVSLTSMQLSIRSKKMKKLCKTSRT